MHPFPLEAELPNLVGDEIAQIWLDPWAVRLIFQSGIRLYIEHGYEHTEPDGTVWTYDCDAASGPAVLIQRLLYRPIVEVHREDLRLTFVMDDGAKLAILSELGMYESGNITLPNGRVEYF